jgi:hypothetical protein
MLSEGRMKILPKCLIGLSCVLIVIASANAIEGGWDSESGDDCGDSYDGSSGPSSVFLAEDDPELVTK